MNADKSAGLFCRAPEIKSQSKFSAWETIERESPEYAVQIKRLIRRIGGGSLFTVYEVELKDGTHEVVRVLNPNAWYHAKLNLKIIRNTLQELTKKDVRYERTLPLLDVIEEWIRQEMEDATYESDDQQFHKL